MTNSETIKFQSNKIQNNLEKSSFVWSVDHKLYNARREMCSQLMRFAIKIEAKGFFEINPEFFVNVSPFVALYCDVFYKISVLFSDAGYARLLSVHCYSV